MPAEKKKESRLYRSETNRVIAGVCGGLGEYFNIDPTIIRILFVLITLFGGSGILIYIILWLVIPSESSVYNLPADHIKENAKDMKNRAEKFAHDIRISKDDNKRVSSRPWLGFVIVILGVLFLLSNFGYYDFINLEKFWPAILIILGLVILMRK